jgi:hypothetical protein
VYFGGAKDAILCVLWECKEKGEEYKVDAKEEVA